VPLSRSLFLLAVTLALAACAGPTQVPPAQAVNGPETSYTYPQPDTAGANRLSGGSILLGAQDPSVTTNTH
jgi:predicted small lipoprotein YifL